jgi:ribosomal protein S20
LRCLRKKTFDGRQFLEKGEFCARFNASARIACIIDNDNESYHSFFFICKALEKYRKTGSKLKCKICVQSEETIERDAATEQRAPSAIIADESNEKRTCAMCAQNLQPSAYNRNQYNKGAGKSKCRGCVEKALSTEQAAQEQATNTKLEAATTKLNEANKSGNIHAILVAETELSALQSQQVTGLNPVKMGNRGGRGSGRGRARGRGWCDVSI